MVSGACSSARNGHSNKDQMKKAYQVDATTRNRIFGHGARFVQSARNSVGEICPDFFEKSPPATGDKWVLCIAHTPLVKKSTSPVPPLRSPPMSSLSPMITAMGSLYYQEDPHTELKIAVPLLDGDRYCLIFAHARVGSSAPAAFHRSRDSIDDSIAGFGTVNPNIDIEDL